MIDVPIRIDVVDVVCGLSSRSTYAMYGARARKCDGDHRADGCGGGGLYRRADGGGYVGYLRGNDRQREAGRQ